MPFLLFRNLWGRELGWWTLGILLSLYKSMTLFTIVIWYLGGFHMFNTVWPLWQLKYNSCPSFLYLDFTNNLLTWDQVRKKLWHDNLSNWSLISLCQMMFFFIIILIWKCVLLICEIWCWLIVLVYMSWRCETTTTGTCIQGSVKPRLFKTAFHKHVLCEINTYL